MRALLSVSDKTNLVDFASGLAARGYELVSTGGTARALVEAGLTVTSVSTVTGFPEMMDGRVKTLHPAVHGGILARRDRPDDLQAIEAQGIRLIDVVVVNLYPFARAAADPRTTVEALIEEIDIGGPTLVRAAAKNFRHVVVVVDPADYRATMEQLDRPGGLSVDYRLSLACKAFAHTRSYDDTIAGALSSVEVTDGSFSRGAPPAEPLAPDTLVLKVVRQRLLRYGENPHQTAALYADGAVGFGGARVVQGKALSFTNLLDLDAAARLMLEFEEPAAVVVKHMNPCGVATAASLSEAYVTAREVDPLSAFGGIVGLNRPVDRDTATAITSTFIEAVVAPDADPEARVVFATKKNLRLVLADCTPAAPDLRLAREVRSILGAILVQEYDRVTEAASPWSGNAAGPGAEFRVVTSRHPTEEEWAALRLAWRVCAHVKSNAVVFAAADRLAAIGAGQTSRVDAVKVATMKATTDLSGTAAASDAFFPFRDGLDAIAAAGATAVVQPGGSVRDEEVIGAANEHGITMVFTGRRHFRH